MEFSCWAQDVCPPLLLHPNLPHTQLCDAVILFSTLKSTKGMELE